MTLVATPTENDVCKAFGDFLTALIVPTGTRVIRGPIDRAAQPTTDHVVFTPIFTDRLRTNIIRDDPDNGIAPREQGVKLEMQVDFYGETVGGASMWKDVFTTVFRDELACNALAPTCQPLYADEGRMMPLVTGEEQFLERWLVRAFLQYNPVVTPAQQYANALNVTLTNVDEAYPP